MTPWTRRRAILAEVVPGCFITPGEIVWCIACRTEIRPDAGGAG